MKNELEKISAKGFARVDFMAHLEDIKIAVNAGYTKISIWRYLHENGFFRAKYHQFLIYVAEYLTPPKRTPGIPVSISQSNMSQNSSKGFDINTLNSDYLLKSSKNGGK